MRYDGRVFVSFHMNGRNRRKALGVPNKIRVSVVESVEEKNLCGWSRE